MPCLVWRHYQPFIIAAALFDRVEEGLDLGQEGIALVEAAFLNGY
jgi:hypothetical protein